MEGNVLRLVIMTKLPLESGVSAKGNSWRKQNYVGETLDKFPKKVCFSIMGDAIDSISIEIGNTYDVSVDVESRSYVGKDGKERWATDVKAWKAEKVDVTPTVPQTYEEHQQQNDMDRKADAYFNSQPAPTQAPMPDDSLPF